MSAETIAEPAKYQSYGLVKGMLGQFATGARHICSTLSVCMFSVHEFLTLVKQYRRCFILGAGMHNSTRLVLGHSKACVQ